MIHNHEVGGSGPPLATENEREVNLISFPFSVYLLNGTPRLHSLQQV
jgi:hypothetical protein